MKFKDLSDGELFEFSPEPGTRETAVKVGKSAFLLRTGERVELHAQKTCTAVTTLKGSEYRLGVDGANKLIIFSQANDTHVFVHDFLVIGHTTQPKTAVRPVMGKAERQDFEALVHIIMQKLFENVKQAENLLNVLQDSLFQPDDKIKLT